MNPAAHSPARQRLVIALGAGGLLPFAALSAALWLWPGGNAWQASLLGSYALGIICFLCGIWWGLALLRRVLAPLVLGNVLVVLAVLGHALLSAAGFMLLAIALLFATWLYEGWHPLFRRQPVYYRRLRGWLTLIATLCLLLALPMLPP